MNNFIDPEAGTLCYTRFDGVHVFVHTFGLGAVIVMWDLEDAFHRIPVSLLDYWLLAYFRGGCFVVELCLPFGLRTSPYFQFVC
jgi:hypothetical protein